MCIVQAADPAASVAAAGEHLRASPGSPDPVPASPPPSPLHTSPNSPRQASWEPPPASLFPPLHRPKQPGMLTSSAERWQQRDARQSCDPQHSRASGAKRRLAPLSYSVDTGSGHGLAGGHFAFVPHSLSDDEEEKQVQQVPLSMGIMLPPFCWMRRPGGVRTGCCS